MQKKIPAYLTVSEINLLLEHAPHERARLLMLLQWRAGLRVSEALALTWGDFDLAGRTIRVQHGKGDKERLVPMHPELISLIRSFHILKDRMPAKEKLLSGKRWMALKWVKDAAIAADITKQIGTHTLRHSAARHWSVSGVPVDHISQWLGHSRLEITMVYLRRLVPDPGGHMEKVE